MSSDRDRDFRMCMSGEQLVRSRVFIDCEIYRQERSEWEGEVVGKEPSF